MTRGSRHQIGRIARLLAASVIALAFFLPFYWAVVISLRPLGSPPPSTIVWWPSEAQWSNYTAIFSIVPFARYFLNSVRVAAVAVPLTWFFASITGFGLSRLPYRWRRLLVPLMAIMLVIPGVAFWIIRFRVFQFFGLLDTLWALIAPAFMGGNPLFILLFYWTFRRIPQDLYEAARMDGASWWQVWVYIGSPLSRATGAAVVVLAFVKFWSDFTDPVLYIFDTGKYTLPVGLQLIRQLDQTNIPLLMVGAVFMILPVLVVFITMQRVFWRERPTGLFPTRSRARRERI
ncbi:MAG: carbohydrate ABC transporter permease [Ardenticatenaceae bacterium]|nr:carbohydrate ABC transporter permease [Ardenticatenaceae bacterium]